MIYHKYIYWRKIRKVHTFKESGPIESVKVRSRARSNGAQGKLPADCVTRCMRHPENPFGHLALSRLLTKEGASWKLCEDSPGITSIEVNLPIADNDTKVELACEDCGSRMRPFRWTSEYPFAGSGIVVRYHNVLSYLCDRCPMQDSPEDMSQRELIGKSLQIIIRQLASAGLTVRHANLKEVKTTVS